MEAANWPTSESKKSDDVATKRFLSVVESKSLIIVFVVVLLCWSAVAVAVASGEQLPDATAAVAADGNSQLHSTGRRTEGWWSNHLGRGNSKAVDGDILHTVIERNINEEEHVTTSSLPLDEHDLESVIEWDHVTSQRSSVAAGDDDGVEGKRSDGRRKRRSAPDEGGIRGRWHRRRIPDSGGRHPEMSGPYPAAAVLYPDREKGEDYLLLRDEANHPQKFPSNSSSSSIPQFLFTGERKEPVEEVGGRGGSCNEILCMGGASCIFDASTGKSRCQCLLGTAGILCEKDLVVKYPRFSGRSSYIAFPVLRGAHREFVIAIEFRPQSTDGVLLFSADHPSARFDFLSIAVINSRVEFRFDCGSGMAVIRSANPVSLGTWNNLTVHRSEWNAWLRLNHGVHSRGKAKGQFSRINFREDLFLGGYPDLSRIGDRTGTRDGFRGCVRRLEVNSHVYDMRKGAFVGDALRGVDIEDCSDEVCLNVSCENGALCVADNAAIAVCQCPLGTTGNRCQSRVQVRVPMFGGQSFLQYPGLQRNTLSFTEIEIVFKPTGADGLILYNGFSRDRTGDFIDLVMRNGYVEYRFDLGTGPAIIRSEMPVSLGDWHFVRLARTGRNGFLKVDDQPLVEGMASGAFTQLTLTLDLFIGGHRNYDEVAKAAQVTRSFTGCVQKVVINKRSMKLMEDAITGLNINNCDHPCVAQPCLNGGRCQPMHDRYSCSCPLRYSNTNCEDKTYGDISAPRFMGDSYLLYINPYLSQKTRGRSIDLEMRVRPRGPNGLLFWVSEEETGPHGDYLAVGLANGFVRLSYNLGSGEAVLLANQTRIDDDLWHRIKIKRFEKTASLEVDGNEVVTGTSPGSMKQLTTHGTIFLGGMDDVVHGTLHKYSSGFVGCLSNVTLATDFVLELVSSADDGSNISPCYSDHSSNAISPRQRSTTAR